MLVTDRNALGVDCTLMVGLLDTCIELAAL